MYQTRPRTFGVVLMGKQEAGSCSLAVYKKSPREWQRTSSKSREWHGIKLYMNNSKTISSLYEIYQIFPDLTGRSLKHLHSTCGEGVRAERGLEVGGREGGGERKRKRERKKREEQDDEEEEDEEEDVWRGKEKDDEEGGGRGEQVKRKQYLIEEFDEEIAETEAELANL
ncbi:hypothetical protein PoB_002029300 [Plakobranchus ocellatus]|uniref:Uncharacterized protein n=1 Tax=Plakobranchus ocellatus TaxID=259542 RepID=A0AAV3ZH49_9GAST|nr:hypothetical protein PoB_002029300 [Plakobranchus ocellatus]